ncbi:crotonase/enoyl-CoA hydratase family protein [Auritidibacter ignavus]|uniref:crotonase/enoyl-CoA hydratase family protein n=1 Tax=Auritidibacter ignavus TaxID=678932 RepID=UPI0024B95DB1|nr:crotonase/enoyl-CoA hydratase family protein [Auritidibacter ignavus]WHS29016.1 crotonase/enoyl-CoA hydratase family protein [Auritidibacter ignavus]WHS35914.1 crotonase/enoyl-CoA hydratase family protein [Auritidibacter ignavus]
MMESPTDQLITERRDQVLIITLNRPKAKNAATKEMSEAMVAILDDFDRDDSLAVAILTGAEQTFCAGMDLKAFAEKGERPFVEGKGFLGIAENFVSKPVIAAVEGYALAGGFETMLACDLVVASETATFGLPEVKRGLIAAGGGVVRLPRRTHRAVALHMVLTGDLFPAEFVYRHGLVNELVPEGTALDAALEMAQKIAANGPLAVRVSKQVVVESASWTEDEMMQRQRVLTEPVGESEDALEGSRAFAEKRAPQWKGR